MNVFLNVLWVILGGFIIALEYIASSIALMATIIGIPFGLQTLKLSLVAIWPFGTEIKDNPWPSGCLAGIMNVIWWFVGGIPIILTHLALGLICCITIIGIPFGMQHFKLARLALFPFGTSIE